MEKYHTAENSFELRTFVGSETITYKTKQNKNKNKKTKSTQPNLFFPYKNIVPESGESMFAVGSRLINLSSLGFLWGTMWQMNVHTWGSPPPPFFLFSFFPVKKTKPILNSKLDLVNRFFLEGKIDLGAVKSSKDHWEANGRALQGACQNGWSDNSYPAKLGGGELAAPLLNRHKYEAPVGHRMQSLCVNCDVVDNRAPSGGNRLAKLVCVNWSVTDSQAPSRGNRLPFRR